MAHFLHSSVILTPLGGLNNMIRLIASDMDGTLLNNRSEITFTTVAAINAVQRTGIRFLINTGREYSSACSDLKHKKIYCDMICSSGAATYDQLGNSYNLHPIPKSVAAQILTTFFNFGVYADVYTNQGRAFIGNKAKLFRYYDQGVFPSSRKENKLYYRNMDEFFQMVKETKIYESIDTLLADEVSIFKISTTHMNPQLITRLRRQMKQISGLSIASTSDTTLEISDEKAQKGYALLQYAKIYNIAPNEILVLGDSENDLSMLTLSGVHSIAMGNAKEEIKEVCAYITRTNEDNGVAYILERLLKDKNPSFVRNTLQNPQASYI